MRRRWAAIGLCLFVVALAGCGGVERSGGAASASTTSQVPERPTTSVPQVVYTVQTRDTLSRIASRFNTTTEALRQANGLSTDVIRPGQSLRIPSQPQTQPTVAAGQGSPVTTGPPVPAPTSVAADGPGTVLLGGGLLLAVGVVAGISLLFVRLRHKRRGVSVSPPKTANHLPKGQAMGDTRSPLAPVRKAVIAAPDSPPLGRPTAPVREPAGAAVEKPGRRAPAAAIRTPPPVVRPKTPPMMSGDVGFLARVVGLAPMAEESEDGEYAGLVPGQDLVAVRPCPGCGTVQSVAEAGCPCVGCGERLPGGSTYPWPVVLVPKR